MNEKVFKLIINEKRMLDDIIAANPEIVESNAYKKGISILPHVMFNVFNTNSLNFIWETMAAPVMLMPPHKPANSSKLKTRFDPTYENQEEYIREISQALIEEFNEMFEGKDVIFYRPIQPNGQIGNMVYLTSRYVIL